MIIPSPVGQPHWYPFEMFLGALLLLTSSNTPNSQAFYIFMPSPSRNPDDCPILTKYNEIQRRILFPYRESMYLKDLIQVKRIQIGELQYGGDEYDAGVETREAFSRKRGAGWPIGREVECVVVRVTPG
jgi:hypothetical protein